MELQPRIDENRKIPGLLKGKMWTRADFDETPEDFKDLIMSAFIPGTHTFHSNRIKMTQIFQKETIRNPENTLVVSIVAFFEIAIKEAVGS